MKKAAPLTGNVKTLQKAANTSRIHPLSSEAMHPSMKRVNYQLKVGAVGGGPLMPHSLNPLKKLNVESPSE